VLRSLKVVGTLHLALLAALVPIACGRPAPPASNDAVPTGEPVAPDTTIAPDGFTNRVWRVAEGSDVPAGPLYVFLSDGTLLIASSTGTPMVGQWSQNAAGLILVEEGIAYATDIVSASAGELRLRSHNPGGTLDLRLVPAAAP
jgi:hypothetical protein